MCIPIQLAFILKCHHLVGCIIITKYKSNSNHGQYLGVCTWCCTEHFLTSSGGSWECAILLHFVFSLRWLTVDACDLRLRWPMDFDTTCLPVNPWFFFARRRVSDLLSGSVSTLEMMGEHRRQRRTRQLLVSILYACWGALHGTIYPPPRWYVCCGASGGGARSRWFALSMQRAALRPAWIWADYLPGYR